MRRCRLQVDPLDAVGTLLDSPDRYGGAGVRALARRVLFADRVGAMTKQDILILIVAVVIAFGLGLAVDALLTTPPGIR
jgi:hypothetical protein